MESELKQAKWAMRVHQGEFQIYWQYADGSGKETPAVILPIGSYDRTKTDATFITTALNLRDLTIQESQ